MRVTLKDEFQAGRVEELYTEARLARGEVEAADKPQVLILASPTGSGKTVMATALMELIIEGDGVHEGDEEAVFLWLSDSPELNEQSRRKIESDSSAFDDENLKPIEADTFNQRRLEPGKVYFLNIQKLGRKSKLLKEGDDQHFTIWETIENTIQESPSHFWLIIDEAHRGMRSAQQERDAVTIVQKFVKGSSGEVSPVPLILGISATPERFEKVLEKTGRTKRVVEVTPAEVRASGLLKERLSVFHPDRRKPADVSFLRSAATALEEYRQRWNDYIESEGDIETFEPILVVQVEDAGKNDEYSKTDLEEVLVQLEDVLGPLEDYEIAHSFQEHHAITVGDRALRYVPPSDIQEDADIRVVLFKQSLNTGWDCPRAEVVMSFRSASDYTNIAQLIGRLVRTPLARAVKGNDFLNSVALYLPGYQAEALARVEKYLTSKETGLVAPPIIEPGGDLVEYPRVTGKDELFTRAETLPTYEIERERKRTHVQRLIKLSRYLTNDKIEPDALTSARQFIIDELEAARKKLSRTKAFKDAVKNTSEIGVREVTMEAPIAGEDIDNLTLEESFNTVTAATENVNDVFNDSGRRLGEGLHKLWLKARVAAGASPTEAKAELYALISDNKVWESLQSACSKRFFEKKSEHKTAISALTESRRQQYNKLNVTGAKGTPGELMLPPEVIVAKGDETYKRHLYAEDGDTFSCDLNDWEKSTVKEELKRKDVLGWLRNEPRKSWSMLVPYEWQGNDESMFPDFLFFRQDGEHLIIDILDPHWRNEDSAAKARGLARFAEKHGHQFGRIEVIRKEGGKGDAGKLRRLDVNNDEVRAEVVTLNEQDNAGLLRLFDRYATS